MNLDTILFDTKISEQPELLEDFLYGVDHDGGDILLKTSNKKTMKVSWRGRAYTIGPAGRRVPRRIAIQLIKKYGRAGFARNKDLVTGVTRQMYQAAPPARRDYWDRIGVTLPEDNFIYHDDTADIEQIKEEEVAA